MHPEAAAGDPLSAGGLPPIKPPSGKFIAQLFLVPLLIVVGILGLFFVFKGLIGIGGAHTAQEFLNSLDQTNSDVRWRAAQDLAQVLPRDDKLASDPKFALDLAERLRKSLKDGVDCETSLAELSAKLSANPTDDNEKAVAKARKDLEAAREYTHYLSASLGGFTLPIGMPLLLEMALDETGKHSPPEARRRRQAVWSLANLGMNLKRFDNLASADQESALLTLEGEAAGAGERGRWAKAALAWMDDRRAGKPRGLGDRFLTLADADDPGLREMTAHALNFWFGGPEENRRIDETLSRLSYDTGKGQDVREQQEEPEGGRRTVTRKPGAEIRYNATVALARRGSDRVRIAILEEMLDEPSLQETFRVVFQDGREEPDKFTVWLTLSSTLSAVAELHRLNPGIDLSPLVPKIEALTEHANPNLRTEAKTTLNALTSN
jgi:hypothetical protein